MHIHIHRARSKSKDSNFSQDVSTPGGLVSWGLKEGFSSVAIGKAFNHWLSHYQKMFPKVSEEKAVKEATKITKQDLQTPHGERWKDSASGLVKGQKIRLNRLGAKEETVLRVDDNIVYTVEGNTYHVSKVVWVKDALSLEQLKAEANEISRKIDKIVSTGGRVSYSDPLSNRLWALRAQIKKLSKGQDASPLERHIASATKLENKALAQAALKVGQRLTALEEKRLASLRKHTSKEGKNSTQLPPTPKELADLEFLANSGRGGW